MIHRPVSHCCHHYRHSMTLGVLRPGNPGAVLGWVRDPPSPQPLRVSPFSEGGCRISVRAFSMKCSSWATWQAVSGLSPVITTT